MEDSRQAAHTRDIDDAYSRDLQFHEARSFGHGPRGSRAEGNEIGKAVEISSRAVEGSGMVLGISPRQAAHEKRFEEGRSRVS